VDFGGLAEVYLGLRTQNAFYFNFPKTLQLPRNIDLPHCQQQNRLSFFGIINNEQIKSHADT
jgi:hypothetical protein